MNIGQVKSPTLRVTFNGKDLTPGNVFITGDVVAFGQPEKQTVIDLDSRRWYKSDGIVALDIVTAKINSLLN